MMGPIKSSIRLSQFAAAIVLTCFSAVASAQSYRVLLSNDDGIESPRLHAYPNSISLTTILHNNLLR